jgi:hypothetical protein
MARFIPSSEGGRNRLEFQPQGLPTGNFCQCEHGHSEHNSNRAEDPTPHLPRHHRAQTQELGFSRDLQQINAAHGRCTLLRDCCPDSSRRERLPAAA